MVGRRWAGACGALLAALAAPAAAAVDCAHPVAALDKLICDNPDLAAAEDQLAAAYRRVLDRLSDPGRGLMGENQHAWANYVAGVCPLSGPEAAVCVAGEDRRRVEALETAVAERGPYRFAAVESFAAKTAPSGDPPALTRRLAYPRIDQPSTAAGEAWNRAVAEAAKAAFGTPDDSIDEGWLDWRIAYADLKVISVVFSRFAFRHGAAHPLVTRAGFTWWMARRQAVTADRLFDAAKPWPRALARVAAAMLKTGAPPRAAEPGVEALAKLATDERRWVFGPVGLTLLLDDDGQGRPRAVEIPWTEITPLLRADAELPVRVEPVAEAGAAPAPQSAAANDWLLVPGQRAGPVTPELTATDLRRLFSADYADQQIDGAEGQQFPGGVLYGARPDQALTLIFDGGRACTAVLAGAGSRWHLENGLTVGMPLARLEELNGKPVKISDYGLPDGGYVDFDGGRLQALNVEVAPSPGAVSEDELARLNGSADQILSTDPLLRKSKPVVVEIDVRLCP